MKITLKTIFTAAERQLIRNNQAFILNSSSSQTESDSHDGTVTNFDAADLRKALFFEPLLEGAFSKKKRNSTNKTKLNENQ